MTRVNTRATLTKGHGTENDFLILADPGATRPVSPDEVRRWCDRRAGFGADGLLRVVRTDALVAAGEIDAIPDGAEAGDWFMDYRNADGSLAEMCGNGVRVFAHWLQAQKLVDSARFCVATRAGGRQVTILECDERFATVRVEMGAAEILGRAQADVGNRTLDGLKVDVGNPHLAVVLQSARPEDIAAFPLTSPKVSASDFPQGVNLEVLTPLREGEVSMRVFERGVGETRSCGTGTVAAALAALTAAHARTGEVSVHVPGGTVTVDVQDHGAALTGPSELVGTIDAWI
ncbi:diaminopimelate epimerase [Corynebacterium atypicum]|uniref:Diaminopimelate epimerase n=1 Tax=Corynebacterium atypicum TaxID=191610 RepID=A0ABM5QMI6_9CORY|nr:diaminopimelate epimerase [Corynebacterium atypicum]AIG64008.1 diaminopimelate epimerase [Corynebacterium atypicum]